ncbi:uncharacterized protein C8R40DRAFT_1066117 [Lentinula edodes]|uniref:uncharacterized protein n=1 Tax=Lentinula edodes TaxID=5353 RepID=UPI001E8EB12B|nr:uncharacterized protein C8R40DRAFT_1066117 [Lentinula edodes]KAH7879977.1 hypothetical protein C8R40DRAFT_1066117 [Lentinula edodes]
MYPMSLVHLFLLWTGLLSSSFLQVGVVAIPMPNTSVSLEPRVSRDLSAVEAVLFPNGRRKRLTRAKDKNKIATISFETELSKEIVWDSLLKVQCGGKCSTRLFWIIHALEELRQSAHITSFQFSETRWLVVAKEMIESRGTADGRSVVGTPAEEEYKKLEMALNAGHDITVEQFQDIALGNGVV